MSWHIIDPDDTCGILVAVDGKRGNYFRRCGRPGTCYSRSVPADQVRRTTCLEHREEPIELQPCDLYAFATFDGTRFAVGDAVAIASDRRRAYPVASPESARPPGKALIRLITRCGCEKVIEANPFHATIIVPLGLYPKVVGPADDSPVGTRAFERRRDLDRADGIRVFLEART